MTLERLALRLLELRSRRLVDTLLSGDYLSVFQGRGIEFKEVRPYQMGDDVRSIDWNVTARMGEPYVKEFVEERELVVVLAIDVSGSMAFGSIRQSKWDQAVEFAAAILFAAVRSGDRVGALFFGGPTAGTQDQGAVVGVPKVRFIPPKKGRGAMMGILSRLLAFQPAAPSPGHGKTGMGEVLTSLGRILKRRAVIFLLSDFLPAIPEELEKDLKLLARRHDCIAVRLTDPRERELPSIGLMRLEDFETGEQLLVDTADPLLRSEFAEKALAQDSLLAAAFRRCGVDLIPLSTLDSFLLPLLRFFALRAKRRR